MLDKQLIVELYKQGFSHAEISKKVGSSRQRVHQIITGYGNTGRQRRKHLYRNWGKCELCIVSLASVLHHKDFNNWNDDILNLIRLCSSCHGKMHRGRNHVFNKKKSTIGTAECKCGNMFFPVSPRNIRCSNCQ